MRRAYSLHRWFMLGRAKCTHCGSAWDDNGQKTCPCCHRMLSRKRVRNTVVSAARATRNEALTASARRGEQSS